MTAEEFLKKQSMYEFIHGASHPPVEIVTFDIVLAALQLKEYECITNREQKGWVCPVCGKVYAPSVSECSECNNNKMKGMEKEESTQKFTDSQDAFDALMGSLLTNVKERRPDPSEKVICRMVSNGAFVSGYIYQEGGKYKVSTSPDFYFEDYGDYECDYWFPKPKLNE